MKLNIIIEVKDSEERYVAENKFSPFKFVIVQLGIKGALRAISLIRKYIRLTLILLMSV